MACFCCRVSVVSTWYWEGSGWGKRGQRVLCEEGEARQPASIEHASLAPFDPGEQTQKALMSIVIPTQIVNCASTLCIDAPMHNVSAACQPVLLSLPKRACAHDGQSTVCIHHGHKL